MQRPLIMTMPFVAVGAAEVTLINLIINHPEGDTRRPGALVEIVGWALVPLVVAVSLAWLAHFRARPLPLGPLWLVAIIGPLLGSMALSQYDHNAEGWLFLAWLVQWGAVVVASFRVARRAT